ncbi:hypothetical protein BC831DRAFT_512133 [Entophlyctis helioformis]|nr:hypothetical protein BC831DRAFT_512133 [Entophlyctis helioformis]
MTFANINAFGPGAAALGADPFNIANINARQQSIYGPQAGLGLGLGLGLDASLGGMAGAGLDPLMMGASVHPAARSQLGQLGQYGQYGQFGAFQNPALWQQAGLSGLSGLGGLGGGLGLGNLTALQHGLGGGLGVGSSPIGILAAGPQHYQHQTPFSFTSAGSGSFGARGAPFNVPAGGANVIAELQEIAKDLMTDRARDFHHLELVNDMVDARCHGRQVDQVIQALVQGVPVNPQALATVLLRERQLDHSADNVIRTVVNESKYNRRADEILANIVSGRPHLRRYDENIKNRKDDAQGHAGWLPLTRNRAKKQLIAVRELMTPSPIAGSPGLGFLATFGPSIVALKAHAGKGIASTIDQVTAGGCLLGNAIASGVSPIAQAGIASPFGIAGTFGVQNPLTQAAWAAQDPTIGGLGLGYGASLAGGLGGFGGYGGYGAQQLGTLGGYGGLGAPAAWLLPLARGSMCGSGVCGVNPVATAQYGGLASGFGTWNPAGWNAGAMAW